MKRTNGSSKTRSNTEPEEHEENHSSRASNDVDSNSKLEESGIQRNDNSRIPSGDPPKLLSVRPYPTQEINDSKESKSMTTGFQETLRKIPNEILSIYNNWLQDRKSVERTWDSYFQHMLLSSLRGIEDHEIPPTKSTSRSTSDKIDLRMTAHHTQNANDVNSSRSTSSTITNTGTKESKENDSHWSLEEPENTDPPAVDMLRNHAAIQELIQSYQMRGHLVAKLDPLGIHTEIEDLEKRKYRPPPTVVGKAMEDLTDIDEDNYLIMLENVYCHHIGIEYMFLNSQERIDFVRKRMETPGISHLDSNERKLILTRLLKAVLLELFVSQKWPTTRRFGLQGAESLVPGINHIIDRSFKAGIHTFIMGMAHRGRLNVITNIIQKPLREVFSQLRMAEVIEGSNDTVYHLGSTVKKDIYGKEITLTLMQNPSHVETVSPIVIGRTRSEQFFAEYSAKGTIHFIINNRLDFMKDPKKVCTSPYCSDLGTVTQSPIFRVNGDDPDAVIHCCNIAVDYRNNYHRDVVVEIVCYRRYEHAELDDSTLTQSLIHKKIRQMPNVLQIYIKKLTEENVISEDEAKNMCKEYLDTCEKEYQESRRLRKFDTKTWLDKSWDSYFKNKNPTFIEPTGVNEDLLKQIGIKLSTPPSDFNLHRDIAEILAHRMKLLKEMKVDWALAEGMAFGSLVLAGNHVRLSGKDSERGTFGQRFSIYNDEKVNQKVYMPLKHLSDTQGDCTICNSSLCEYAILGFELGYSMTNPHMLVMWEPQFGDLIDAAQVVIDTYISCGEAKWGRQSGIVLLIPHGLEGQGPDHSSGRMERLLIMCDDDPDEMPCLADESSIVKQLRDVNWTVVCTTTPANYFHVLRRQLQMPFRKPLILFTPKQILKTNRLRSHLSEMAEGTSFIRVIPENGIASNKPKIVKRLIFCTGRVYYDLIDGRDGRNLDPYIAISRVEQLCPFPYDLIIKETQKYPKAEICWVQEEHKNSGAWNYVFPRFSTALQDMERDKIRMMSGAALNSHIIIRRYKTKLNEESFMNGPAATYVEEMFNLWLKDRNSVHASWDIYFKHVLNGAPPGHAYQSPPTIKPGTQYSLPTPHGTVLENAYCKHIGVEIAHIESEEISEWIKQQFEPPHAIQINNEKKRLIFEEIAESHLLESFMDKKWHTQVRFSLEGNESLIPGLTEVVDVCAVNGAESIILGMAHRGRMNVLAIVCKRPIELLFAEFLEIPREEKLPSDVKYHLGSNSAVVPIVIHGDAGMAGQGVVFENFNLAELPCYTTKGTIHIVTNNQIGYTTVPSLSRSSSYCTGVAKMMDAPIFHVNSDDPEAVIHCCKVAAEFRNKFHRDVVIDIIGYRRKGHNENDDPKPTSPLFYQKILSTKPVISEEEFKSIVDKYNSLFTEAFNKASNMKSCSMKTWVDIDFEPVFKGKDPMKIEPTGVKEDILTHIGKITSTPPPGNFGIQKSAAKQIKAREDYLKNNKVSWALAEALAIGSLLKEGIHVRLTGEDSARGTFHQRHHVYYDVNKETETYTPLNNLYPDQEQYCICNSPLSEYACLGFELGYATTLPDALVLWEAQYGDFANVAQPMFDNFLAPGEVQDRNTQVVDLSSDDPDIVPDIKDPNHVIKQLRDINWIVANCTTPANVFHILRRQVKLPFRKPLIFMTAKSLLRHPDVISPISDLFEGTEFKRVIPDDGPANQAPDQVERLLFCSGKAYYDINSEIKKYPKAELCWGQEEHKNSGPWNYVFPRIDNAAGEHRNPVIYAGRVASASTATGLKAIYNKEKDQYINECLTLSTSTKKKPSPKSSSNDQHHYLCLKCVLNITK
ncbi:hypothetical protein C0J52_02129 [Blattella germanica]|nr:hypothetical protein C0J52_02129 [Blattella germanica]